MYRLPQPSCSMRCGAPSRSAACGVVRRAALQHAVWCAQRLCSMRRPPAQVLVASDAMTRGMDVENVDTVVNYDAPVYAKVSESPSLPRLRTITYPHDRSCKCAH